MDFCCHFSFYHTAGVVTYFQWKWWLLLATNIDSLRQKVCLCFTIWEDGSSPNWHLFLLGFCYIKSIFHWHRTKHFQILFIFFFKIFAKYKVYRKTMTKLPCLFLLYKNIVVSQTRHSIIFYGITIQARRSCCLLVLFQVIPIK